MAKIKVALRVRPFSERELTGKYPVVVGVKEKSAFITDIRIPERPSADSRQRLRQFYFDHGFWLTDDASKGASQEEVYKEIGPPMEKSVLAGYNACLLAYGQSGTGKTHTMLGTKADLGLIPRFTTDLWNKLRALDGGRSGFRMEVSFIEIYREKVRDLLTPTNKSLKLREHPQLGPHVQDLTRIEVCEELSLLDLLWEGESRRASGTTGSNRHSSRSHAIWTLYLSTTRQGSGLATTNQVHLVDLAGSEKADLITAKNLLAEGKDINRSLVSLGNVISALAEKSQHIPYRDSALTWLLRNSLGGNAATSIIITASPASSCHAQTLNSLRFAERARLVENRPEVNFVNSQTLGMFPNLSTFDIRKDIARLATIIRSAQATGGIIRGLMPRNGWNRLIAAIESWTLLNEQQQRQKMLEDSGKPSSVSTSASKSTSSDATIQTNLTKEGHSDTSSMGTSQSQPSSSNPKILGSEVFIPYSNSIKCLTWRQQEVRQIPKTPSTDSESETFMSPSASPPPEMKINQLKYLTQVRYPICHNLDKESRIAERIHGSFQPDKVDPIKLHPIHVKERPIPVVNQRRPTLVNPQIIPEIKETVTADKFFGSPPKVLIKCESVEECTPGFGIPEVSEFAKYRPLYTSPFESTDEDEETMEMFPKEIKIQRFQLKRHVAATEETIRSSVEEALFFSETSTTSSSPTESLKFQDNFASGNTGRVRIIQNCQFDFNDVEERLHELDNQPQQKNIILKVRKSVPAFEKILPGAVRAAEVEPLPLNKVPCSKFRNHFVNELNQMEDIGNKIKNLRKMTQRFQIAKPYLDEIARLDPMNYMESNPDMDAEIEECSGWNVDVELQKVQEEFASFNKLLKYGPAGINSTPLSTTNSNQGSLMSSNKESTACTSQSRRTSNASTSSPPIWDHLSDNNFGRAHVKVKAEFDDQQHSHFPQPQHYPIPWVPSCQRHQCAENPMCYQDLPSACQSNCKHHFTTRRKPILPKTHNYLNNGRYHPHGQNHKPNSTPGAQYEQSENPYYSYGPLQSPNIPNTQYFAMDRSFSVGHASQCGNESFYMHDTQDPYPYQEFQVCHGRERTNNGGVDGIAYLQPNTNSSTPTALKKHCNTRSNQVFHMY